MVGPILFRRGSSGKKDEGKNVPEKEAESDADADSSASSIVVDDQQQQQQRPIRSVLPLSMRILKACGGCGCQHCKMNDNTDDNQEYNDDDLVNLFENNDDETNPTRSDNDIFSCPDGLVRQPMMMQYSTNSDLLLHRRQQQSVILERILMEYKLACQFYSVLPNAGVLTALRYQLPCLRITSSCPFQDADLLAVAEILFKYLIPNGRGPLHYLRRLDFSRPLVRNTNNGNFGFGSHGAFALAKVLQVSSGKIEQVFLDRNRIGPFGATAIFMALAQNPTIKVVKMRRCRVSERGGIAFATHVLHSDSRTGLQSIDLSANHIGYRGCIAIERAIASRSKRLNKDGDDDATPTTTSTIVIDLEGNLVFQEIMNSVTHGLGVLLAAIGSFLLSAAVADKTRLHYASCAIYSLSLVVLYTSSTLYHSFFSLRNTKYVFEVMDKCAIYILIAGSYTPCLQIVLSHEPIWSTFLLAFLWLLCFLGIFVEFVFPTWPAKGKFSLFMYLCMGWSALICLPEVARMISQEAINLMVLGGVAYTAGVPFFVRDNNLDHAIWHVFVLAGSVFHWCGIYFYIIHLEHSMIYS